MFVSCVFHLWNLSENIDFVKQTWSDRDDDDWTNETFWGNKSHRIYDIKQQQQQKPSFISYNRESVR